MEPVIERFRLHHRELLAELDRHLAEVDRDPATADLRGLRALLTDELLPHARGEERHLYPAVEEILRRKGSSTATMTIDHEAIEGYVERIVEAIEAGGGVSVRRLLDRLDAVLRLHLEKEERVYLPLMAETLGEAEQRRILDELEAEPSRD